MVTASINAVTANESLPNQHVMKENRMAKIELPALVP
jgi:hypothetical protein